MSSIECSVSHSSVATAAVHTRTRETPAMNSVNRFDLSEVQQGLLEPITAFRQVVGLLCCTAVKYAPTAGRISAALIC